MLTRAGWQGEWLIIRRHPLVWLVAMGAIGFIAFAAGNESPQTDRELFEALLRLNLFAAAFVLPFVAGAIAPVFYLREVEHGMHDLFAAYPQSLRAWLTVRLGSFAILLVGICAFQQMVIAGSLALERPGQFGELALQTTKLMALVFLPASLIWASILAWISFATAKASMVYLAAAFGWLAYVGLATLTATPLISGSFAAWEPLRSAMLLVDPYAITALVNPPPLDTLLHSREIAIVFGRIVWMVVCYVLLRRITEIPGLIPSRDNFAGLPSQRFARRWKRRGAPGHFMLLLRWTVLDKFWLLALAGWALLVFPEVYSGMDYVEPLSQLIPDSRDALNRVMWDMTAPAGALLLLYAADRTSRMASANGMAGLMAATPYASWRSLAAQLACLWVVALVLIAFTLMVVLMAQLAAQSSIQPREYLEQAGQVLPGLLLSATTFLAVHGAVRSRLAANLIGFALVILAHSNLAPSMGLAHPLFKPMALPLTKPDHILGLGNNWEALLPFALFWGAICAVGAVIAVLLHHRGLPDRQVPISRALLHPAALAAAVLLAAGVWQGLVIHRTLTGDFALISAEARAQRRADYERRYSHWLHRPQPHIAEVRSFVDFGADGRSVDLRVTMELVNRTGDLIDLILVGRNQIDVAAEIAVEGGVLERRDAAISQTVYRLASPMEPGARRKLHFRTRITRSAVTSTDGLLILRPQFASLPAYQILPVIGFQREFTLRDPAQRAKFGLPPLAIVPPSRILQPGAELARHQARFETIMSVPHRRYGVAPGYLVRSWSERGRSYFHFQTDRAIRNAPLFLSVPWSAQQWKMGPVTAEIHAPGPILSGDPNLLGMRDTLAWFGSEVAPYPGKSLRLIAAPEFGPSGFAAPQIMLISHLQGFRASSAPEAGFNQAYRRAVHETAHQWFGHYIGYGIAEERAFLIESLAKYAELVMVERRYGTKAMQALIAWEADRLARARLAPARAATALIDAEDSEDQYSRATLAFACLRSHMSDAQIAAALQEIAATSHRTGRPARSMDLLQALKTTGGTVDGATIDRLFLDSVPIETALLQTGCTDDG